VTLSRVGLGGRIPAVYDQQYNCHNLPDGSRRPPATMFTTPRLLLRQQQAHRLRIAISAYPTCIRRPRYGRFPLEYRHPVWYGKQEAQLSLRNRALLVCKVVEVWQDFLSEYVDKSSRIGPTYATDG